MALFAIALTQPSQPVADLIQTHYPRYFEYSPTLYLVETDALAQDVAINVGIKGDSRVPDASGFVLKSQEFSYSGYTTRALWEWFKDVEKHP